MNIHMSLSEQLDALVEAIRAERDIRIEDLRYGPQGDGSTLPAVYVEPRPKVDRAMADIAKTYGRAISHLEDARLWMREGERVEVEQ